MRVEPSSINVSRLMRLVMTLPIGTEGDFVGVVDVLTQKAYVWDDTGLPENYKVGECPADMVELLAKYRAELAGVINTVQLSPGRMFRSAVDMSRLAPFVDAAVSIDRTAWPNLFISYYTYGQAIGLGLDLSLRDRSQGKVTGDAFMNALWAQFGRPGQKEPGKVSSPYTIDGLKESLAKVSGDRGFANDFFAKFIEGREVGTEGGATSAASAAPAEAQTEGSAPKAEAEPAAETPAAAEKAEPETQEETAEEAKSDEASAS